MFKKLPKSAVAALVTTTALAAVTGLLATAGATPAAAAAAPLSDSRVAVHFDVNAGRTPENLALAPNGDAYVTFAKSRQVAEVSPRGAVRILATLPAPADGGGNTPALNFPLTVGIVRADDGTLYFLYATGTADLTGVWRLRPGGRPQRIAALPADSLPNGLALDARTHTLYVTDSALGAVWRVPTGGGEATVWASGPALAPAGFLGANGLKLRDGAVWASNLDKGTIVRIPVLPNGRAGALEVEATGLTGVDDFAFTGRGDQILAALDSANEVALVQPDGSHSIVLSAADGLDNPTSVAVRGTTVYVLSAAYLAGNDPNLVLARLDK
jgi:sugar lactone lactonase YvrE